MTHGNADRSDEGFTLIEVLITLVVMAIAVTGLIAGIMTAASGSASSQNTTDSRQALSAVAEQIQNSNYHGASSACAAPTYAGAIGSAQLPVNSGGGNTGPAVTVTAITFWNGTSFVAYKSGSGATSAPAASSADCTYDETGGQVDQRMQTITLTSSGEDLTILKRSA